MLPINQSTDPVLEKKGGKKPHTPSVHYLCNMKSKIFITYFQQVLSQFTLQQLYKICLQCQNAQYEGSEIATPKWKADVIESIFELNVVWFFIYSFFFFK